MEREREREKNECYIRTAKVYFVCQLHYTGTNSSKIYIKRRNLSYDARKSCYLTICWICWNAHSITVGKKGEENSRAMTKQS